MITSRPSARANAPASPVCYEVRVDPPRHEIHVTMTVPEAAAAAGKLRVESPTWVPGDYSFAAFGRDVFCLEAADAAGGSGLVTERSGWQAYEISGVTGDVTITYTAYCSSWGFSEACGILDEAMGVLTGARYLRVPDHEGECVVTYVVPDGWKVHHPSGAVSLPDHTWAYPSYEILLDTPVCLGDFDHLVHDVHGTTFHYVFLDSTVGSTPCADAFASEVDAAAATFYEMFGSFPFDDYTFVCSVNPMAEWGLEHLTSTMVGLGPVVFTDPRQHATGIRVCAHELFHAWNVRRLRPAPLGRLDLTRGSFSEGLWVAEGFTRYYEFLSCTRTGVYTADQFFSAVVNYFRYLTDLTAYERVSPIDSSLASFLNHDEKYPGRVNDAIDYYDAGMGIAFSLDTLLRTETDDQTLDSAFAAFYSKFVGREAGYTPEDLRDFLDDVHPGAGKLCYDAASRPGALPVVDALSSLGFDVTVGTVPRLGIAFLDDGAPTVYGVLDTSPAGASGIAPEDVVTAVDAHPFDLAGLSWAVAEEREIVLDVWRGNERLTYALKPERYRRITGLRWVGDEAGAERISRWLGSTFDPAAGEELPLDFYDNFHGIVTVV